MFRKSPERGGAGPRLLRVTVRADGQEPDGPGPLVPSRKEKAVTGSPRGPQVPLTFVTPLRFRATVWDFRVVCSTRLRRVSNSFWGSRMRRQGYSVALWKKDMSGHSLLQGGEEERTVTQREGLRCLLSPLLPGDPASPKPSVCVSVSNILFQKQCSHHICAHTHISYVCLQIDTHTHTYKCP